MPKKHGIPFLFKITCLPKIFAYEGDAFEMNLRQSCTNKCPSKTKDPQKYLTCKQWLIILCGRKI